MEKQKLESLLQKLANNSISYEEYTLLKQEAKSIKRDSLEAELNKAWNSIEISRPMDRDTKNDILTNIYQQIVVEKPKQNKYRLWQWNKIAVAASLLLLTSYLLYEKVAFKAQTFAVVTDKGQKNQIELPDGTIVWLNSNSKLTYSSDFNNKNRRLQLDGEAFFHVKYQNGEPFIVGAAPLEVKVLGTEFNVKNHNEEDFIEVSLKEGKVSVTDIANDKHLSDITKDQKITYSKNSLDWNVDKCNGTLESLWTKNILRIEDASMDVVLKQLERWYGVSFTIDGKITETRYGLTIKSESLNEALQLINTMTPMEYDIKGEEVHIRLK